MARTQRTASTLALLILSSSCQSKNRPPRVDTEETLGKLEIERRKAYAADASVSMVVISSSAADADICSTAPEGEIGPTPPISVNCNLAGDGKCSPVESPKAKWEYAQSSWNDPVWKLIDFDRTFPHRYHYSLRWRTLETGECESTAMVFGDLDDDGIYSTYEFIRYDEFPDTDTAPPRRITNALE